MSPALLSPCSLRGLMESSSSGFCLVYLAPGDYLLPARGLQKPSPVYFGWVTDYLDKKKYSVHLQASFLWCVLTTGQLQKSILCCQVGQYVGADDLGSLLLICLFAFVTCFFLSEAKLTPPRRPYAPRRLYMGLMFSF